MASRTDSEKLKAQAKHTLAEGRAEIAVETRRLRRQLNPNVVAHRLFDQHTGAVILGAFAGGLILAFLLFRDRDHQRAGPTLRKGRSQENDAKHSKGGLLGTIARVATPLLIKHAVAKPLEHFFAQKRGETGVS